MNALFLIILEFLYYLQKTIEIFWKTSSPSFPFTWQKLSRKRSEILKIANVSALEMFILKVERFIIEIILVASQGKGYIKRLD